MEAPATDSGSVPEIGDRVDIWWPDDGAFYSGRVTRFSEGDSQYFIEYDDGETEYLDMKAERWRRITDNTAPTAHSPGCVVVNEHAASQGAQVTRRRRVSTPNLTRPISCGGPSSQPLQKQQQTPSDAPVSTTPHQQQQMARSPQRKCEPAPVKNVALTLATSHPVNESTPKTAAAAVAPSPVLASCAAAVGTAAASNKLEPWKRAVSSPAVQGSPSRPRLTQTGSPPQAAGVAATAQVGGVVKVPRYKLQPRLSNGKFGALPANMKLQSGRAKNSEVVLESGSGGEVMKKQRPIAKPTPVATTANAAAKRPTLHTARGGGVAGTVGVKRPLNAPPKAVTLHAEKGRKSTTSTLASSASNNLAAAASTGVATHGEVAKKKQRVSANAQSVQPMSGVVSGAGSARVSGGGAARQGAGGRGGSALVGVRGAARHAPGSRGAEQSVVARNFAALKEGVGDTKEEIGKLLRSVTHLHSMHNDLTKQMRIDEQEGTRRNTMLNNEVERLRLEIRSLASGQKELLAQLAQMSDRMDSVLHAPYLPRPRSSYRGAYTVPPPVFTPMDYERPAPPPAAAAAMQRRHHSYSRNARRAYPDNEWPSTPPTAAAAAPPATTTTARGISPTAREPPYRAPPRRVSADRVPPPASGTATPGAARIADSCVSSKHDILLLVARQATIWLLETDHECRSANQAAWAHEEATKCMERVAYLLNKFSDYTYAMRTLADSLGSDAGQLEWFTDSATPESLALARQNYDVWDPPPTDAEWINEEKLLVEISLRFHHALNSFDFSTSQTSLAACVSIATLAARAQPPPSRSPNGAARRSDPPNGDHSRERGDLPSVSVPTVPAVTAEMNIVRGASGDARFVSSRNA